MIDTPVRKASPVDEHRTAGEPGEALAARARENSRNGVEGRTYERAR